MFDHLYMVECMRQTKELEFINFQQECMTILVYITKLTELANFVSTLDIGDARKARYFEK